MALAPTRATIGPEAYLEAERQAENKHEYDNGYVVAMVGASRAHNLITLALATEMHRQLRNAPCRVYMADMKVRIQTRGNDLFYYPDIMVACDRQPPSDYYENQPLLIVEVLSPSTETRDKLEKLAAYTSLPSLREYFTIAQERIEIDRYSVSNGETTLTRYTEGDDVPFASIDLTLPAASLYAGVE